MTQHDPALHRRPRLLDRAKLELIVQVEPFYAIVDDLPPLFLKHWHELATHKDEIPLAPNWDSYLAYAAQGILHVTTVRVGTALVGYIFNLVSTHLHYTTTLHAQVDIFWLDPQYRGGWFPIRWFRYNEKYLKELGVKRILVSTKVHFMNARVGVIFSRLGYLPTDVLYSKLIG